MSELLLISDDLRRAERLVRELAVARHGRVHDLYANVMPDAGPELIVADVARLTSEAILRLRAILDKVRSASVPLLLVAHGNAARTDAQAQVLNASETIPATAAISLLRRKITSLQEQVGPSPASTATKLAAEARQFLVQTFFSGRPITPALATTGSELIARAVEESGIRDWVNAVRRFDDATHQHCLLVAGLAAAFATSLGLQGQQSYRLTKAALLHDVGKTRIPLSILNKPGPLSAAEIAVMRTHAILGYDMLVDSGFSEETLTVVRSHHEALDGSGYPDQLAGNQIPDIVRLVTICDIYGALIERRSYKPPMPSVTAYASLELMTGRVDPDFVRAFRPLMQASNAINIPVNT